MLTMKMMGALRIYTKIFNLNKKYFYITNGKDNLQRSKTVVISISLPHITVNPMVLFKSIIRHNSSQTLAKSYF